MKIMQGLLLIFSILFLIVGCFSKRDQRLGLESTLIVGVIADSQLQTSNTLLEATVLKSKLADSVVKVAIRTPAQRHLAPANLKYILKELATKNRTDILLYLGDGANNGCKDELDELFGILEDFRNKYSIPVFYVVGNHDYLGAGNTSDFENRNRLCSRNPFPPTDRLVSNVATKYALIKIIHEFNLEGAMLAKRAGWKYENSFSEELKGSCEMEPIRQHSSDDCFYASLLTNGEIELLLLDTSNYGVNSNIMELPEIVSGGIEDVELAGTVGGICCADNSKGQVSWFKKSMQVVPPKFSIVASHYTESELEMNSFSTNCEFQSDKTLCFFGSNWLKEVSSIKRHQENLFMSQLFRTDTPTILPIWLTAHSHKHYPDTKGYLHEVYDLSGLLDASGLRVKQRPVMQFDTKLVTSFLSINIGSTTDWKPHALVLELSSEGAGYYVTTPILTEQGFDREYCDQLLSKLESGTIELRNVMPVLGETTGLDAYGLTRAYQRSKWKEIDLSNSIKNLEELIENEADSETASLCLAFEAAKNEHFPSKVLPPSDSK